MSISKISCAVHDDRIWVCGSRDAPYACDSYDENWEHQQEKNTIHAHSYGSMVSAPDRGLTIIGKILNSENLKSCTTYRAW